MLRCPFECGYQTADEYSISLHVETGHPELEESPFATVDVKSVSLSFALQRAEEDAIWQEKSRIEGASPPMAPSANTEKTAPAADGDAEVVYVECPQSGCGEHILLVDLNDHLDIHASLDDLSTSPTIAKMTGSASPCDPDHPLSFASREHEDSDKIHYITGKSPEKLKQDSSLARTVQPILRRSSLVKKETPPPLSAQAQSVRLGKAELGPFAYEREMPRWLYTELKRGPSVKQVNKIGKDGRLIRETFVENEVSGLMPLLAQLSDLCKSVEKAYLCHPSVQHCYKRKYHGGFCGYLNIQMQISYIQGARAQGYEHFDSRIPGVLDIQDMIEEAWDKDFSPLGRLQTGGVKNTRKWIGSPEVAAIYESLGIDHESKSFHPRSEKRAHRRLYDFVENYFSHVATNTGKIITTQRAPIYFQQPGHSLTIVGFERHKDGSRNLLVFDPAFGPSKEMQSLIGKRDLRGRVRSHDTDKLMHAYRRTSAQLRRHNGFETISLSSMPPSPPT